MAGNKKEIKVPAGFDLMRWVYTVGGLLLVLFVFCIAVALFLSLRPADVEPISPTEETLSWSAYEAPPLLDDISSITAAPLFWSEREAYVVPLVETSEDEPQVRSHDELDDAELLGVLLAGLESSVILTKGNEKYRVTVGGTVLGWTLKSVNNTQATFEFAEGDDVGAMTKVLEIKKRPPLPSQWQNDHPLDSAHN